MKLIQYLRYFTIDPVDLSIQSKFISLLACCCSIYFIALITKAVSPWPGFPQLVASMGATAIILFFIPGSPLAQPWPLIGGHLFAAAIGVFCALNITDISLASAVAVGGSVLVMLMMRCLHPPAAATSLTAVLAGSAISSTGYYFILVPVGINVLCMLLLSVIFNRWLMHRNYPIPLPVKKVMSQRHRVTEPSHQIGFTEQDLTLAMKHSDIFIDMSHAQLCGLLSQAEMNTFKRIQGNIVCADIMIKNIPTLEFGTEVEQAWDIMYSNQFKAI